MPNIPAEETTRKRKPFVRAGTVVEQLLPVSKARLYQLCAKGFPHYKIGKVFVFDLDEVEQWIREHRRAGR